MNEISAILFLIFFMSIFGATFAFMWKMMSSTLSDLNQPIKTKVPAPHPEMEGVKYGEELMVFNVDDLEDDEGGGDIVVRP